jgi:Ala-tRNA(Pro) deacylase
MMAKVVMVMADGRLAMFVLPATARIDLEKARRILGAKDVRLATEDEFIDTFSDCDIGAMPPFGDLYGVPLYVDKALEEDEIIYFQACTHTDAISVAFKDYLSTVNPCIVNVAARIAPAPSEQLAGPSEKASLPTPIAETLTARLNSTYEQAVAKTRSALASKGFGIITEIDVQRTLRDKLGVEFRRYLILGACNPSIAHAALEQHLDSGLLLPCNVAIYEDEGGSVIVIQDPERLIVASEHPDLAPLATIARKHLEAALAKVYEGAI